MIRIAALYPNTEGSRFDRAYYTGAHTDFARRLLEPHGLQAISTSLGESALDRGPPPFWAISEMQFASLEAFNAAMSACGSELFADIPNYTDVQPVLQICRTLD